MLRTASASGVDEGSSSASCSSAAAEVLGRRHLISGMFPAQVRPETLCVARTQPAGRGRGRDLLLGDLRRWPVSREELVDLPEQRPVVVALAVTAARSTGGHGSQRAASGRTGDEGHPDISDARTGIWAHAIRAMKTLYTTAAVATMEPAARPVHGWDHGGLPHHAVVHVRGVGRADDPDHLDVDVLRVPAERRWPRRSDRRPR